MIDFFRRDVRIAARVLLRSPGFTLVAVLTVGIAIGANASIFSVVNGVLLRPLPYAEPEELITFSLDASRGGAPELPLSPAGYWHFRNKSQRFADLGGYVTTVQPLTGDGPAEQVAIAPVTWSLFPTLGLTPAKGRTFTEEEDVPGGPDLAVVSHDLWRTRYGGDPGILGRTIELNGVARQVIGVMPEGFDFPSPETSIWIPLRLDPATQNFGGHFIRPVARLRAGATLATAREDVEQLIARFGEVGYGPSWFNGVFTGGATVESLRTSIIGESERPLLIVFGALGFVLLIACTNIASLFLVRTKARTREIAVRRAMGATRTRIVQYTLAESTLIALASGVLGIVLAVVGTRVLAVLRPAAIPRVGEVTVDIVVVGFVALTALGASFLLGALPALRAAAVGVSGALRDGGRSATAGRERQVARGVLVVTEIALAVILLVGSGLMVRTAQALSEVDPGFETENVLTFSIALPPIAYQPGDRTAAFFHELAESIRQMPGVTGAGAVDFLPLAGGGPFLATTIDDHPLGPDEFPPAFNVRRVTPGYFEAVGIPVLEGRAFDIDDHAARLGTSIISVNVREKYWTDRSPLGRRITPSTAPSNIVGVVGNVRTNGLDEPFDEFVYLPMVDSTGGAVTRMAFVVRAAGDPLALMPRIREEVRSRDANLPITGVGLLEETVADSMAGTTFTTLLLVIAAGIALILGAVGIYGLISFIVGERTAEIGIRMSLGASARSVMGLFLRQAWLLAGAGILIGLVASLLATRLLQTLLFGISTFDALTWVAAPLTFFFVATVACLVPARRAATVDPASAFRQM